MYFPYFLREALLISLRFFAAFTNIGIVFGADTALTAFFGTAANGKTFFLFYAFYCQYNPDTDN
jgi:hypothetical protein